MSRCFMICFFVCAALTKLPAQHFRENICFGFTNGFLTPGPLSHRGSFFTGFKEETFIGYTLPSIKSSWGMESDFGLAKMKYRSKFDNDFFLKHRQTLFAINLLGFVKISEHLKLAAGINCFFPISYRVSVSQKKNTTLYTFGNTDLNSGYSPTEIQAGAVLGLEYLIGKKQKWNLGLFVNQMGNGPVKLDRDFASFGIPIFISDNLKPMHFDFRIAFHLSAKKRDRMNVDE